MGFIRSIRENLKDPKKKSLTLLGIYLIFFIIVFILFNTSSKKDSYISESEEDEVTSYEYIYNFNSENGVIEIIGTHKDTEDLFTYNGLKYYKKDNVLYTYQGNELVEVPTFPLNIDQFGYENIEKIVGECTMIDETSYSDKSSKINYNININDLDILNIEDTNLDIMIPIEVKTSDYIEEVTIDLTNYYNYKYTINIKYDNINKIDSIKVGTN